MKAWRRSGSHFGGVGAQVCPTGVNMVISDAMDPYLSSAWTWAGADPDSWDMEVETNGGGFVATDPPSVVGSARAVTYDKSPDPGDTMTARIRGVIGGVPCAWEISNFLIWPG